LVGIFLERTPDLIAAILGVLKAGGAYVPLDPAYPPERLAFIVGDAQISTLITQRELVARLPAGKAGVLLVDEAVEVGAREANRDFGHRPARDPQPATSLAYVIYTSGSTGQPKGVAIEHRSVIALIAWARQVYRPEEFAGVLASTSVCFDVSVFELLVPLCCGGRVILAENILQLPMLPAADEVIMINTVPSAMRELFAANMLPPSVRTLNFAGEPLPQSFVEQLYQEPGIERVFDLYGPTEATVYSTYARRQPGSRATIGRPLANEQAYVLDRQLQPVPVGVPGELYLGGDGLARGYWQRAELTAEKFLENPFRPGTRFYRTGDLVRYRPDGNIEFIGRLDQQIKLRGYRIELGEIESVLRKHAAVRECAVVVRTDQPDDKRLVAYLVPGSQPAVDPLHLRGYMRQKLPEYMVPSAFVVLKKLPLLPSGKLDQRALPAPEPMRPDLGQACVMPRTTTEEAVADIWQEVLGLGRIGIHDNFFELGGHSLLATQVLTRVQENFRVALSLRQFFGAPTVAELASAIEEALVEEIKTMSDEEADRLAGEATLSAKE
jgi:amino acid adenylation domain-containing protein